MSNDHVTVTAKPLDLERLGIVAMVHLRVWRFAQAARFAFNFAALQIDASHRSATVFLSLFQGWWMRLAPFTRIGIVTFTASNDSFSLIVSALFGLHCVTVNTITRE